MEHGSKGSNGPNGIFVFVDNVSLSEVVSLKVHGTSPSVQVFS